MPGSVPHHTALKDGRSKPSRAAYMRGVELRIAAIGMLSPYLQALRSAVRRSSSPGVSRL